MDITSGKENKENITKKIESINGKNLYATVNIKTKAFSGQISDHFNVDINLDKDELIFCNDDNIRFGVPLTGIIEIKTDEEDCLEFFCHN